MKQATKNLLKIGLLLFLLILVIAFLITMFYGWTIGNPAITNASITGAIVAAGGWVGLILL